MDSAMNIVRERAGETGVQKLAALGSERLRCGQVALREALTGRDREQHRFVIAQHLKTIEQLEKGVIAFDPALVQTGGRQPAVRTHISKRKFLRL